MTRLLIPLLFVLTSAAAQDIRVFKTIGGTKLTAHIFQPQRSAKQEPRAAIVIFHGGGWVAGSPEWVYYEAKHYAAQGIVAIAAEYRLSDEKEITPLEAMEDARDLIVWVRHSAAHLGVNPKQIAAYGSSAGAHLAAAAAIFHPESGGRPDALVLMSPRRLD